MHVWSFASGSDGNCYLVESEGTTLLVECGRPYQQVMAFLDSVGIEAASVAGIVLTHAHGDHSRSARYFSQQHRVPIYASIGTLGALDLPGEESTADVVIDVEKETSSEEVNRALKDAANGELRGILAYSEEPLVSSDFKQNSNSSIIDAEYTKVIGGHMIKILSWYDNEWGYSCRVRDLVKFIAEKGL